MVSTYLFLIMHILGSASYMFANRIDIDKNCLRPPNHSTGHAESCTWSLNIIQSCVNLPTHLSYIKVIIYVSFSKNTWNFLQFNVLPFCFLAFWVRLFHTFRSQINWSWARLPGPPRAQRWEPWTLTCFEWNREVFWTHFVNWNLKTLQFIILETFKW